MWKKRVSMEPMPSESLPDPLSQAKGAAITDPRTDMASAWDVPASRLFSGLVADTERDIRREAKREWAAMQDEASEE